MRRCAQRCDARGCRGRNERVSNRDEEFDVRLAERVDAFGCGNVHRSCNDSGRQRAQRNKRCRKLLIPVSRRVPDAGQSDGGRQDHAPDGGLLKPRQWSSVVCLQRECEDDAEAVDGGEDVRLHRAEGETLKSSRNQNGD